MVFDVERRGKSSFPGRSLPVFFGQLVLPSFSLFLEVLPSFLCEAAFVLQNGFQLRRSDAQGVDELPHFGLFGNELSSEFLKLFIRHAMGIHRHETSLFLVYFRI